MKSKIEVREYALNKAVELLGQGAPVKDAVAKAKEIDSYIIGEAILPEVNDETAQLMNGLGNAVATASKK